MPRAAADVTASYAVMFDTDRADAKDVMLDMANRFGHTNEPVYRPNEENAASNAVYRAGQQSVLVYILHQIAQDKANNEPTEPTEA